MTGGIGNGDVILEMPNVVTSCKISGTNFIFSVRAYRKLSDAEMKIAIKMWMREKRIKKVPRRGKGMWIAIHGFDSQIEW